MEDHKSPVSPPTRPQASLSLEEDIAFAMELPQALLPVMPELYAGLPDLSGATEDVLALLRRANLSQGAAVLDLGCGRGEIALRIAEQFGARVTGIDGTAPFLDMARQSAAARGLSGRCNLAHGDLRVSAHTPAHYDAALLISLGPVLGDAQATLAALRGTVRPGGLILIDDGYLLGPPPEEAGWEDYADLEETERRLTAHGDRIEARLDRRESMAGFDAVADPAVLRNVAALRRSHPERAQLLQSYVEDAFSESALWNTVLMPALWCLRKV